LFFGSTAIGTHPALEFGTFCSKIEAIYLMQFQITKEGDKTHTKCKGKTESPENME
jgi:hypothetical protein